MHYVDTKYIPSYTQDEVYIFNVHRMKSIFLTERWNAGLWCSFSSCTHYALTLLDVIGSHTKTTLFTAAGTAAHIYCHKNTLQFSCCLQVVYVWIGYVSIVALAVIRLNYFILILEWVSALIVFLSELFHFGIVCLLLLYRLKTFICSKGY